MNNRSVVVTGGAQGIGKAISLRLAHAGMHVVVIDVDERAGSELLGHWAGQREVRFVHGSAGDPAVVEQAVALASELGDGLHAVVGNAGVSRFKPLHELQLDEWEAVLRVNLTGAFLLARAAAPYLDDTNKPGAIVLMASSRALMSEADTEAYSASKGGIVALTHSLAISLGPGVRVNCVSPGWIATDDWQRADKRHAPELSAQDHAQHPAGRVGKPEDIAAMVQYLISADAAFITGQNLVVDGGMTRKMIYV